MNMQVTKVFTFDAAHYLPNHPKCGRMHGHTYKLEVTVSGVVNKKSGMVMDFSGLKDAVEENVLCYLDHRCLNLVVVPDEAALEVPTAENLCQWIWLRLHKDFRIFCQGVRQLHRVRVWETPNAYAQLYSWDAFEEAHA